MDYVDTALSFCGAASCTAVSGATVCCGALTLPTTAATASFANDLTDYLVDWTGLVISSILSSDFCDACSDVRSIAAKISASGFVLGGGGAAKKSATGGSDDGGGGAKNWPSFVSPAGAPIGLFDFGAGGGPSGSTAVAGGAYKAAACA